jgi:type IV secretory pathway TrbD component
MEIPDVYCARFHESSNRPDLLLGCDPFMLAGVFLGCIWIAISLMKFWGFVGSFLLFLALRYLLQEIARSDPKWFRVYFEAQRFNQNFWTAKPIRVTRWRSK